MLSNCATSHNPCHESSCHSLPDFVPAIPCNHLGRQLQRPVLQMPPQLGKLQVQQVWGPPLAAAAAALLLLLACLLGWSLLPTCRPCACLLLLLLRLLQLLSPSQRLLLLLLLRLLQLLSPSQRLLLLLLLLRLLQLLSPSQRLLLLLLLLLLPICPAAAAAVTAAFAAQQAQRSLYRLPITAYRHHLCGWHSMQHERLSRRHQRQAPPLAGQQLQQVGVALLCGGIGGASSQLEL